MYIRLFMASVSLGGGLPGIYGCLWPLSPLAEGCQVYTAVYRLCLPLRKVASYIRLFIDSVSFCERLPGTYGCLLTLSPLAEGCLVYTAVYRLCLP